jgi:WhiB family redox-sensing transcriptional regulator
MLGDVDFDVGLGVDFEVGLEGTTDTPPGAPPKLTPVMLTPVLDSRSPILMTWRDRAACLDEDPELFFPIGNGDPAFRQIERAKVVCHRCEVIEACLSWAMESRQDDGVWGGLSADERRALKRRNARARRADPATPLP